MSNVYNQAAQELLSRRVAGKKAPCLSADLRPSNVEDALCIQSAMMELHDDSVAGWKCLQPLAGGKLVVGPIFANGMQQGEHCELYADEGVARIEPEIAFVLSKGLPANSEDYTEAQINDAIGSCHMALELIQARYAADSGAEFPDLLADGLANQGLFIGPEIERDKAFSAASIAIEVTQGDNTQSFAGVHPNDNSVSPIYWLVNYMTRRGVNFQAGEALITGSYCGVVAVEFNQLTQVNYSELGQYKVTFTEKQ